MFRRKVKMKKLIRKSLAVISVIILCGLSAVQAKEIHAEDKDQIIVSEETINMDGYDITVAVYEDTKSITPFATTYEKSGKKSYTAKNSDGDTLFSFTVHGTFSINSGVSATCTKSSYTYSISSSAWELKSTSASRTSNKAIGDAEFIKKILLIKVDTLNPHVVLSCSNNGSLS